MCIGINMPVKTTIFSDVNKFDGSNMRLLHSHEYTQAAGRAGRLGLDKVGNVIHLNNLFKNIECSSYKIMMKGNPQTLSSKFKISYNLILNLISINEHDYLKYIKKSMIQTDITNEINNINNNIEELNAKIVKSSIVLKHNKTPIHIVNEYIELTNIVKFSANKKRKNC